jgi:hypothetical protein
VVDLGLIIFIAKFFGAVARCYAQVFNPAFGIPAFTISALGISTLGVSAVGIATFGTTAFDISTFGTPAVGTPAVSVSAVSVSAVGVSTVGVSAVFSTSFAATPFDCTRFRFQLDRLKGRHVTALGRRFFTPLHAVVGVVQFAELNRRGFDRHLGLLNHRAR